MEINNAVSLHRAVRLLCAIVEDDAAQPASAIARALDLPSSTARRTVSALLKDRLIDRVGHGRYAAGPLLVELAAKHDPRRRLIEAARTPLRRLARTLDGTAHLGILDQDMVTYLVKEGKERIFTRERQQLEAYCTGIGKALLAQLPGDQLDAYLQGPFVRLTPQTLAEPEALRRDLERTRARGYAIDDREMADDVGCVAVPIPTQTIAPAAISFSSHPSALTSPDRIARRLTICAGQILDRLATSDAA